jgi:hypothetical protein
VRPSPARPRAGAHATTLHASAHASTRPRTTLRAVVAPSATDDVACARGMCACADASGRFCLPPAQLALQYLVDCCFFFDIGLRFRMMVVSPPEEGNELITDQ